MSVRSKTRHYWELSESGGGRASRVGGVTLADINTVGSAAGKLSALAASFAKASSEMLSVADGTDDTLEAGSGSFEVFGWAMVTGLSGLAADIYTIFAKGSSAAGQLGYSFYVRGDGSARAALRDGSDVEVLATAPAGTFVADTWFFFDIPFDRSGNVAIRKDNAAVGVPASTATVTGTINGGRAFAIGGMATNAAGTSGVNFFNGRIGPLGIASSLLTASERAALYNNGNGTPFPLTRSADRMRRLLRP